MTGEQFIAQVETTQKALRRFLVALCCGDTSLADDIAQDAYVKAYLGCDSLKSPDKFKNWIFTIAYNTFVNHKRSERQAVSYDEAVAVAAPGSADSAFAHQELYVALNRLNAKERLSILLFYMENYSVKEIAEIHNTSQDAVKQHLSRGRAHLRDLLSTK